MLGRRALAELVLSYGAQVDARDDHDRTPLHWATRKGHMQLVRLLLDNQATPDLASNTGKTPLHWAVLDGKYGMAELILGYDPFVDARDNKNQTPLNEAATKGLLNMSRLLLDHGASVDLKNDYPLSGEAGWSHLHWAVFRGAYQMAKMLVEDYSAQVGAVDSYLRTPLHLATRYNLPRMVELLVTNGASMDALNWEGRTPMQTTGHGRIIRLLESFSP